MKMTQQSVARIVQGGVLLGLLSFSTGCIVAEPRDGYYDRDHHRYYHERNWHECHERDEYCR